MYMCGMVALLKFFSNVPSTYKEAVLTSSMISQRRDMHLLYISEPSVCLLFFFSCVAAAVTSMGTSPQECNVLPPILPLIRFCDAAH